MANATISGSSPGSGATLNNATDGAGTPSDNENDVSVTLDSATDSGGGAFYDVNFAGGDDSLVASNMPWVNPSLLQPSVGFEDINMGGGNDFVDLSRSGFRNTLDMGSGNDTLFLTNSGGTAAQLGIGNDLARIDNSEAASASDAELAQKAGSPPLDLDGGTGSDTLNLMGDWTLTLSSGDATLDTNGDGFGDTTTNVFSSSQFLQVTGLPALLNGTVQWGPPVSTSGGDVTISTAFSNFEDLNAVCFTDGTLIDTPDGPKAIETLSEGDRVCTRNGDKTIRWVGKRHLDLVDLMANPKLLPIRVPPGSFGNGLPRREVRFSPQHRVVVRSKIADRLFGIREALIAVKQLVGYNGVEVDAEVRNVTYRHIMLDDHQVIYAEGIEAETFFPGPQALEALSQDALTELHQIFPGFVDLVAGKTAPSSPLPKLKGRDARALVARHIKASTPVYQ